MAGRRTIDVRVERKHPVDLDGDLPIDGVLPISRPVNVALLICVWLPSTKSSALSISKTPPVSGRVADAIKPVTSPVLNRNGVPKAGIAISTAAASTPRRIEGIV